jgi:nucleotide-binding universal stress UspA family protein
MREIKKILFPVDLSPVSSKIASSVIAFGESFDAEIHLVHVAVTMEEIAGVYGPDMMVGNFADEVAQSAERELKKFEEKFFAGYPNKKNVVVKGDPADKIIEYIKAERIDLVVMGTHGRKGLDKILFGSVADQLVKNSPVPVLTINPYRKT